ncbi:MAG: alpha/beta hydrolase, partial [Novosphingobium sp.]|nr:alpha/beta hydrolase [Novosphingobium sp.]
RFGLIGHDWGTRALYDTAILAPDRITAAVALSLGWRPAGSGSGGLSWAQRQAFWYQWYLGTEHGAAAFRSDPKGFCRRLWDTWSPPGWFEEEAWERASAAFSGTDWCDVVIHYYRARWGQAPNDPSYKSDFEAVAAAKAIAVPTMIIHGVADTCCLPELSADCASFFPAGFALEMLEGVGHFPQRENPEAVASRA